MPLAPSGLDIGLRLALTVLAGAALGWDRSAKGHAAGLKTTLLVALAACLSMLLANLLLGVAGKPADSFVQLDFMRLPLGVLTGVGFIGAGAIVKDRGDVKGLTTAATLWIATLLGLCFGAGEHALGLAASAIAFVVLRGLRGFEKRLKEKRLATVSAQWREGVDLEALKAGIAAAGLELQRFAFTQVGAEGAVRVRCGLAYPSLPGHFGPPPELVALLRRAGAQSFEWRE